MYMWCKWFLLNIYLWKQMVLQLCLNQAVTLLSFGIFLTLFRIVGFVSNSWLVAFWNVYESMVYFVLEILWIDVKELFLCQIVVLLCFGILLSRCQILGFVSNTWFISFWKYYESMWKSCFVSNGWLVAFWNIYEYISNTWFCVK